MKAFSFRLDHALRWRATQLDLEKSRTAAAAKRLADIRQTQETLRSDLVRSTGQLGPVSDGSSLELLDAWKAKARRRIAELEKFAQRAQADLARQTQLMLEANRRHKLIENLKADAKAQWSADFGRELEAFAGESFLGRLQSKKKTTTDAGV